MNTFSDYITEELENWFKSKSLNYKIVNQNLITIFCNNYCLKIYDQLGHGYSITVNLSKKYSESIYVDDNFSLYWIYKFFNIEETANFKNRIKKEYLKNIPKMITDLKKIIEKINMIDSNTWENMEKWINEKSLKEYT